MTDNEIIRVLEKSIPAAIEQGEETVVQILKNAVDLINRQRAEIEELKSKISFKRKSHCRGTRGKACKDIEANKGVNEDEALERMLMGEV